MAYNILLKLHEFSLSDETQFEVDSSKLHRHIISDGLSKVYFRDPVK